MKAWILGLAVVGFSVTAIAQDVRWETSVRKIESGPWKGARLEDGQPDIQGNWSNTIANHNNFTDPQGAIPGDPSARTRKEKPRGQRAPSRVSSTADGQIPFQPWALEAQQDLQAHLFDPTQPQYIEPLARCAPAGVPKSFMWHGWEIRQYPGYVLFLFDSGTRIIHLDGSPHPADAIKLWNADSRGHWEGNTLVVDVANNNGKARFARTGEFGSENAKIVERYVFDNDGQHFNYIATITDPTVYTQAWTTTIPVRRYSEKDQPDEWHFDVTAANRPGKPLLYENHERICVENNGPFGQVAVTSRK